MPISFIAIPLLIIMLFRKRWFCRYICPTGLCLSYASKIKHPYRQKITNIPKIGHWVVLLTLVGSVIGYPILLFLDPLAIFSASVNVFYIDMRNGLFWTAFILPVFFLLNLIWTDVWCSRVCPLDATHSFFATLNKWLFYKKEQIPTKNKTKIIFSRRSAFKFLGGTAWATFILKFYGKMNKEQVIRPPNISNEANFISSCIRCGNCINACPTNIIYPEHGKSGIEGFLAPALNFDNKYCLKECNKCSQVCPSNAIAPFSLKEKMNIKIGIAKVKHEDCLLLEGLDCGICITACQYKALDTEMNDDLVYVIKVDETKCVGCGACESICPTEKPRAIKVKKISL